jgi:hypothetical protein
MNMKKTGFILLFCITAIYKLAACGGEWWEDYAYYNLFMQEIIQDQEYFPFLLTLDNRYHDPGETKNENIEEWQPYLQLDYENAHYLVFTAARDEISAALNGKQVKDAKLAFLTPDFVKKHKQALLYLAYAKYLEPYMRISISPDDTWGYYSETINTADQLDYNKVINVLQRSWRAETDNELKLRYGYQLVRFAHYNRKYDEAIRFFNEYVASLHYQPAMYYHALSQKAGAERGAGNIIAANADFFQVFVHSKNLKAEALNSIRLDNEEVDFNYFLKNAVTQQEKNDAYLLLGYMAFNNPVNEIEKIAGTSPDAIQAKVLMARAVNQLERQLMPNYDFYYWDDSEKPKYLKDKRYPVIEGSKTEAFFNQTLSVAKNMTASDKVKEKNFWLITTAYLSFLNKDFGEAKKLLDKVNATDSIYILQKKNLAMYIDISEPPVMTDKVERELFAKYGYDLNYENEFIKDVLANRYFIQKDYAKSFLISNEATDLEKNPQPELLDILEKFYQKPNKNAWEEGIATNGGIDYINYVRSLVYVIAGDFRKANRTAQLATAYDDRMDFPDKLFGYNKVEWFDGEASAIMGMDYREDFPYITAKMGLTSLTETLIRLQKAGEGTGPLAAKANYLLGNFFYNISFTGYYGGISHFSSRLHHYFGYWYSSKPDIFEGIYFKYYKEYYDNPVAVSQHYLEKAYQQARDNELKARIVFALSKCEQEEYYESDKISSWGWTGDDGILITDRKYFAELMKYRQTKFFNEVETNCKYFEYYVNNYTK